VIGFDIKKLFFDRDAVTGKVDKATRKVLSRFGAFVRTSARSSIRKRKKSAPPGQPPSSHSGLLKKFIYFGYEPQKQSVVIGPVKLDSKAGTAPEALEHGGRTVVRKRRRRYTWRTWKANVTIKPRPFMGPAMEKEKSKLPSMWAGSIK
jgi:hypothetical protein